MSFQVKNTLVNLILLLFSINIMLVISEFTLRYFTEKVNYLWPTLQSDNILGHKIKPFSGGHDAWGFRNPSLPKQVDIVTLGDSMTYGQGAPRQYSWPTVLERNVSLSVYNMGLPAYGPIEYFYLLKSKAFFLKPKLIIGTIYLGNDLMDAFTSVYARHYWSKLRDTNHNYSSKERSRFVHSQSTNKPLNLYRLKNWLSKHSLLYSASKFTLRKLLDNLKYQKDKSDNRLNIIRSANYSLTLDFHRRLVALDLENEKVREGLRISLQVVLDMLTLCQQNNTPLLIVLIPTKESIYAEALKQQPSLKNSEIIDKLLSNEYQVTNIFQGVLKSHGIRYFNIASIFKQAMTKYPLYPTHNDEHPNNQGYTIIGEELAKWLKQQKIISINTTTLSSI